MEKTFENYTFSRRVKSMLKADMRRALTSPFIYLMIGIALVIPILILVMTTMMDGTVSVDPNGNQTVMQGFDNVWQILGSVSGGGMGQGAQSGEGGMQAGMGMDLVSMCNINMMYFMIAVTTCVFVADDFRSGYAKNLFTVRAKKSDYVLSKTLVCTLIGGVMIVAFFLGAMLGGKFAGLPFIKEGFSSANIFACMLAKIFLVGIFVSIYLTMSVAFKQRLWLSLLLSFGVGMLLFTVAPMISPLDAGFMHVVLSMVGSFLFSLGLGAVANTVLHKTDIL